MSGPEHLPIIEPMLATGARGTPAAEEEWAAEIKWDGIRAMAYISEGTAILRGRSGRNISAMYPEVIAGLAEISRHRTLILDGEIAAFAGSQPDFARLQRRLHVSRPSSALVAAVPVTFVAFDLLHRAGRTLLGNPYGQRRALLDDLAAGGVTGSAVMIPPAFVGESRAVIDATRSLGLEGVVLKRIRSGYYPGRRTTEWLKIRHLATADIVIGGWLPGAGWRAELAGSVIAGRPSGAGLEYLGQVGSGFAEEEIRELTSRLRELEVPSSPFTSTIPVPVSVARRARWTRPVLAAEVSYTGLTPDGRMRHPVWRGLRPA
jgi:bifunctional non-homologous end joining protein LigD